MGNTNNGYISLQPTSGNLFKYDGPAGLVVFLVALPLCLGIALASNAPLFSGIIAGIVGGLVVSIASGSHVSVTGPAAGLAVIVATSIAELGSFRGFLAAVVIGGFIQLVLGFIRAGIVGDYVPNSVIKGMLAGIGVVIFLKQIPHALGRDADFEGDLSFLVVAGNTLTDIAEAVLSATPGAVLITTVSLAILIGWDKFSKTGPKMLKLVPGPLLVVLAGIGLNEFFALAAPSLHISAAEHMVSLPIFSSLTEFFRQFTPPDASFFLKPAVWKIGLTLAIVGSIESLLSIEAADKLDPYKRITSPNRELRAQGLGNMLSGLLGGLPVTSVVIRTSANVYAGARTRLSAFVHGAFLLLSALLVPGMLNRIPLASLAAILLVIGYKLANVEIFKEQHAKGRAQLYPFVLTVLGIVFTNLLAGVLMGMALGIFFVMRSNHHQPFTVVSQENYYLMRFNKDATFVNKYAFKRQLRTIPEGAHLIVDGTKALYIDNDILEVLKDFEASAHYKRITIERRNLDSRPS